MARHKYVQAYDPVFTFAKLFFCIGQEGARETAQWLRELAALGEDLGLVPSTHMMAHDHPELQLHRIQHALLRQHRAHMTCSFIMYMRRNTRQCEMKEI